MVTYTLTNGTKTDADKVMQNFEDVTYKIDVSDQDTSTYTRAGSGSGNLHVYTLTPESSNSVLVGFKMEGEAISNLASGSTVSIRFVDDEGNGAILNTSAAIGTSWTSFSLKGSCLSTISALSTDASTYDLILYATKTASASSVQAKNITVTAYYFDFGTKTTSSTRITV